MITKMARFVKVWQVGRINYAEGLKLQKYIANLHHKKLDDDVSDTLLLVEHDPVYTIGIRTKNYTEEDETRLKLTGADYYKTDRGGLITFHGPGQLVAYPILNLKHFKPSMRCYVNQIENTILEMCRHYNLQAYTSPHTGVWINDNKVCAIGVHGSRFITTHGLALNCNVDLSWFDHIVPCGIEDKGVTSLSKELDREVHIEDVVPTFLESFSKVFNCNLTNFPREEVCDILNAIKSEKT